jgi:hypothetical protein
VLPRRGGCDLSLGGRAECGRIGATLRRRAATRRVKRLQCTEIALEDFAASGGVGSSLNSGVFCLQHCCSIELVGAGVVADDVHCRLQVQSCCAHRADLSSCACICSCTRTACASFQASHSALSLSGTPASASQTNGSFENTDPQIRDVARRPRTRLVELWFGNPPPSTYTYVPGERPTDQPSTRAPQAEGKR